MKSFYVKDGEIRVPVEALGQDPDVARAVAKEVIFDDMLLTAIVSLALTGECDWGDGSLPWYIINCRSVNFERLRLRIIEVAPEAAKKVAKELVRAARSRAGRAERVPDAGLAGGELLADTQGLKIRFGRRADELDELARICARPAHAEIGGAS